MDRPSNDTERQLMNLMTDEDQLTARGHGRATAGALPQAHPAPGIGRRVGVLLHRWPTALGVAVAALAAYDIEAIEDGAEFATLILLLALVYLGAAVLDRRWSAWVLLLAGVAVGDVLPLLDSSVDPWVVFLVTALIFLVLGVARGQLRKPTGLPLQTAGMLGFGAMALGALYLEPNLGGYLVAAALLGHAAWDALHFRLNSVVPRSYAEFCIILDFLLGAAILVMA